MDIAPDQALAQLEALSLRCPAESLELPAPLQEPAAARPWRQSAVLVLFGALDEVTQVALVQRSTALAHHPGQIAFPGGGAEPGDLNLAVTALREAREETGIRADSVQLLGQCPALPLANSRNLVTPVLAWWDEPEPMVADGSETVDAFTVPVEALLDPNCRYTAVLQRGRHRHLGPMFLLPRSLGSRVVWGFTATVLSALFDDLGWTVPWDQSRRWQL